MLWITNLNMGASEALTLTTRNRIPSGFPLLMPGVIPDSSKGVLWRKASGWSIGANPDFSPFAGTLSGKEPNLWLLAKQKKEDEMRQEDDEIVQILKAVVEHIESGDE